MESPLPPKKDARPRQMPPSFEAASNASSVIRHCGFISTTNRSPAWSEIDSTELTVSCVGWTKQLMSSDGVELWDTRRPTPSLIRIKKTKIMIQKTFSRLATDNGSLSYLHKFFFTCNTR
mmetsp:Transcript_42916/g.43498  ORF Transcript_42916/g.43498 Transcript_42916/m.43498 type:complete len:120 (-) Transcript_42916:446-805(-)